MKTEQADAVIVLENIVRKFPAGETFVTILKGVNLTIKRGEMVAIVGASGSGKSTLMNILGCLDRASSGRYRISGKETSSLSADELSALRRNHFGFIFQRYHLLNELTALGNVEIPAIYAGCAPETRKKRAQELLTRLGMGDRINHRPNQLSGGQQQRVSIARALMNNAEVILADEPTGALDKQSGQEVLRILDELHQEGRTIVIVTHDMQVAERADRIIEISDGEIIADNISKVTKIKTKTNDQSFHEKQNLKDQQFLSFFRSFSERFREAFIMALLAMNAHRMRTFLTMLGVIIGIAAIIAMVALGNGTQEKILENFKSLGSNTLTILPGKGLSDPQSDKITSLVEADAEALSGLPYVSGVTPQVSASSTVRFGAVEANAMISGVGEQFFQTHGLNAVQGRLFDQKSVHNRAVDLVIEKAAIPILFPHSHESPLGKVVHVGKVPARIIGVVDPQNNGGASNTLQLYLPYTTVQTRFIGTTQVQAITVRISDDVDSHLAEDMIQRFLVMRHGEEDFFIRNSEFFRERIMESTHILTLLVSSIAAISLIVGGIGVMNIMLVTVSERINEIGVRMAVGARQSDILQQFLIEAILVCIIGGGLGILFGLSIGGLFILFKAPIHLIYTLDSIVVSLTFSTLIGICFGFSPARQASRLDPVVALSRD
ncbi:MacB family efflux pump subunit [Bartonella doshiae]|uniref:Pyoverdine export ATP-binding/permease protein PvdT n=2 Tax=Bartonella doshiae TaxID=33044 RepID=A0A380ZHH0_BARDO|nr:MacB family efflux pump subunit [Bartonella doshiae]EJF80510.1 macrolide export ATP-binding/permease MacB [Bartonella doshiae NCTC 12862 = ATCC 700133]MBB6158819.1 macrolide transport system ATP-binding/permease protein [Bartonella doshiae]SUV45762.1 Macrolide export ATP-binding/permease protein MacB [Bartonella doshiae]